MPSNRLTACSSSSWNRPGTSLNFGMTNTRIPAAAISRMADTVMAEISPGLTFFQPNRLI